MRYFRLQLDQYEKSGLVIHGLPNKKGGREALDGDLSNLDLLTVISAHSQNGKIYPELLVSPVLMFKETIKEVFDLYIPDLEYKNFCLLDEYNKEHVYYTAPALKAANVISDKSERINLSDGKILLDKKALEELHGLEIFRLGEIRDFVIVALPVAESLLRRKIPGIFLAHIEAV